MQNPNEDTEWNDVLRSKGILPPKETEISEEQIVSMIEDTIQQKQAEKNKQLSELDLDGLDELEDAEDEQVLQEYRRRRIAELQRLAGKPRFGHVQEVSAQDYVQEVTRAGGDRDVWVVLHLYDGGVRECALVHEHMRALAARFPLAKFVRAAARDCVPGFPKHNLPAVFVYHGGELRQQLLGAHALRLPALTRDELEYLLGRAGALPTAIAEDPRPKVHDKLMADLGSNDW